MAILTPETKHRHGLVSLCSFVASLLLLLPGAKDTAAFERPVHLTLFTLIATGIAIRVLLHWAAPRFRFPIPGRNEGDNRLFYPRGKIWPTIRAQVIPLIKYVFNYILKTGTMGYLGPLIGARVWLFWFANWHSQCGISGLHAFVPLLVYAGELLIQHGAMALRSLPRGKSRDTAAGKIELFYRGCFVACGILAVMLLRMSWYPTGTVCAIGRAESYVPLAQVVLCVVDALIFLHLSHERNTKRQELEHQFWSSLSNVLFITAIIVFAISSRSWATHAEAYYAWHLFGRDIQSLLYNSIVASIAIISCISLMPMFGPALLSLIIVSMSLFRFALFPWIVLPPIASFSFTCIAFLFTASFLLLLHFYEQRSIPDQTSLTIQLRANFRKLFSGLAVVGAAWYIIAPNSPVVSMSTAVQSLASMANSQNEEWRRQASSSKSLPEAISEYRRRYGIPPPPSFDKWYEFAVKHNSPIIDDFDQIDKDLAPFWGLSPGEIRAKTTYIMSHRDLEMGSMRIRNGKVDQSPHIPGSHRWMSDNWQKMMEPFAKWLPDMDLAVNLADECHVSVPFNTMFELLHEGERAKIRLDTEIALKDGFSKGGGYERWPVEYPELEPLPTHDIYFQYYDQKNIFGDFIPDSCPPGTPSKSQRWGDWSSSCVHCAREHSVFTPQGAIVSNADSARDLCHQPDMAYLNGFLSSPARVVGSRDLLPIFSQSRFDGFHDILWPSPWDFTGKSPYKKKADMPWDKKRNGMYWRGGSTDGFASHGRWPGFLRPRFNNEANKRSKALISRGQAAKDGFLAVNVSFVGETHRCDQVECAQERLTFHEWAVDVQAPGAKPLKPNNLAPSLPFEEHWQYRHLFDADGAGYSGRFLSFLQSHSVVYRAAAFHTWFDERVHAWKHYVPVDLRLGSGFWGMLDYLSGGATAATKSAASKQGDTGDKIAREIAENGRQWAQKALRPVDMQIYMFRLLLEWARIIDDDRDKLGFVLLQ